VIRMIKEAVGLQQSSASGLSQCHGAYTAHTDDDRPMLRHRVTAQRGYSVHVASV
jgi:D-mannonate dehydratase